MNRVRKRAQDLRDEWQRLHTRWLADWRGLPPAQRRRAAVGALLALVATAGLWLDNLRLAAATTRDIVILAAARDLAAGATLRADDLIDIDMPSSPADLMLVHAADRDLVEGTRLLAGLSAGLPLPWPLIATIDVAPLSITDGLAPGARPFMVDAPDGAWPSGWLQPDSRVDLLWSARRSGGAVARVLHQNLTVLAIEEAGPLRARRAVVAVPAEEVSALMVARDVGRLDLVARPANDAVTLATARAHEDDLWRRPSSETAPMPTVRVIRGATR
jgi:Flp pilus assembly protein CpaB